MDIRKVAIYAVIVVVVIAIAAFAFISINTQDTKIDITCNKTIKNGDYITVQLKDIYRKEIPDQVVDLKILDDSGWAHKYNVTTDELGRGYIQVVALENGNYTAHAHFNGTMFLRESTASIPFEVNDGYFY